MCMFMLELLIPIFVFGCKIQYVRYYRDKNNTQYYLN